MIPGPQTLWSGPNQNFKKSDWKGDTLKEMSPFRFARCSLASGRCAPNYGCPRRW